MATKSSRFKHHEWFAELLALAGAIVLIIAIIILLIHFDGKRTFDNDNFGITLNALVSLLATSSKGCLLAIISEVIGQWNWMLFSSGSPRQKLLQFDHIDKASRGAPGSLNLIFKYRGLGWLLRLGTVITVLAVVLDPLAQQLVQLDQSEVYEDMSLGNVSSPKALRYSKGVEQFPYATENPFQNHSDYKNAIAFPDFLMASAVLLGCSSTASQVQQQLRLHCPTGNCTWDEPFESLAVCSRCETMEDDLEKFTQGSTLADWLEFSSLNGPGFPMISNSTAFQLPNGHFITNENAGGTLSKSSLRMTTYGTGNPKKTNRFQNMDTLIWSMSILKQKRTSKLWPEETPEALECALYYCVNRYSTSVVGGVVQEKVDRVDEAKRFEGSWKWSDPSGTVKLFQKHANTTFFASPDEEKSIEFSPRTSFVQRTDLSLRLQSRIGMKEFNVSQAAVDGVSSFFQSALRYNASMTGSGDSFKLLPVYGNGKRIDPKKDMGLLNGFYLKGKKESWQPRYIQALYEGSDLPQMFENIASSMSNSIRQSDDKGEAVAGRMLHTVTVYKVEWPWIVPHATLILASAVLLFATMRQQVIYQRNNAVPVWKTSALGILSRGTLTAGIFPGVWTRSSTASIAQLEMKAERIKMNLGPDKVQSYGLVGLNNFLSSPSPSASTPRV